MHWRNTLAIIAAVLLVSVTYANDQATNRIAPGTPPRESQLLGSLAEYNEINLEKIPVRYDSASLDSFIRVYMDTFHIPGIATWVLKDGQVIWQHPYGYANLEDTIEVADTTVFMLASISKTFTATAAMQLWEHDAFGLDDDINDYLPFEVVNPNYPDSIITFRMLMTHTSSIRDNWNILLTIYEWGGDSPIPLGSYLEDYLVPGGAHYDSAANFHSWAPGYGFEYCNEAAALLGYLVEEIADSFPIHCQDSIFDPLSMNETSWFLAGLDTNNIAIPYHWTGTYNEPYPHYGYPDYPCGQLRTSIPQLARHLVAIMQYGMVDSVRILDSTTVELMTSIQYQVTSNWMMGLMWMYWYAGSRWIWFHRGEDYGVNTVAAFCPSENSAVIVLTNAEYWSATRALMDALFDYALQYGIEEHTSAVPAAINLQIKPNPFSKLTTVNFSIEQSAERVAIQIYDATGRLVKSFYPVSSIQNQVSAISWRGDDHAGRKLPSGVYFVTLRAGEYSETRKVLLVR